MLKTLDDLSHYCRQKAIEHLAGKFYDMILLKTASELNALSLPYQYLSVMGHFEDFIFGLCRFIISHIYTTNKQYSHEYK